MTKAEFGKLINRLPLPLSIILLVTVLAKLGFEQSPEVRNALSLIEFICIGGYLIIVVIRFVWFGAIHERRILVIVDISMAVLLLLYLLEISSLGFIWHPAIFYLLFFIIFIRELGTTDLNLANISINPALLFVTSFLFMILLGTMLLLLPNATNEGISFTNALFTSTSAVCVTGLIVVDTGSYFTTFGQAIILFLIQLGGLGIMTFTSFFGLFFKGTSSFSDQMILQDITKSEKIGSVAGTLKRIILITFLVEGIGVILIFLSLNGDLFSDTGEQLKFSLFHSISAFCNAGFSTLPNSLYESPFRMAYAFQIVVAMLFIIGGLGFPIVENLVEWIRYRVRMLIKPRTHIHRAWLLHVNAKIILMSTLILILAGTVTNLYFEYDNALREHDFFGKIIAAFFAGVTPRTAGFNNIDMTSLHTGTILITLFLMWIGASPGSTGGGVKTTTFTLALLNIYSLALGKDRIEVFHREVSQISIRRAFATISLSLVALSVSIFGIRQFDPEIRLMDIIFECFSAFSTVGLSLGITGDLSNPSRFVIILTMFVGRVGLLSVLISLFRRKKTYNYRYPTDNININ